LGTISHRRNTNRRRRRHGPGPIPRGKRAPGPYINSAIIPEFKAALEEVLKAFPRLNVHDLLEHTDNVSLNSITVGHRGASLYKLQHHREVLRRPMPQRPKKLRKYWRSCANCQAYAQGRTQSWMMGCGGTGVFSSTPSLGLSRGCPNPPRHRWIYFQLPFLHRPHAHLNQVRSEGDDQMCNQVWQKGTLQQASTYPQPVGNDRDGASCSHRSPTRATRSCQL
jgi:hypothetical protein